MFYLKGSLFNSVPIWTVESRGGGVAEVALDLCDAVVSREQSLPQQPLQHTAHARPVHQLQHK